MATIDIPDKQTVALVRKLGGPVEFVDDYPVKKPGVDEVLAKVLYCGVCQSDLHTRAGTASGPDGNPITNIKLPHIGGHEGVGRIVALGTGLPERDPSIYIGALVGIRFSSRICRRCSYCLDGQEQYCQGVGSFKPTNHLHHEDGAFQEYCCLDAGYLTLLPQDVDPVATSCTLCAGLTAYKALKNADVKVGEWVVVAGAGGGLGQYAVQYAIAQGNRVIGVDSGDQKRELVTSFGAQFLDFREVKDVVAEVQKITGGGASAVVVAAGHSSAFAQAASMLRIGGTMCCIGIPPGGGKIETPVSEIVIKGLKIKGNLVGNLKECLEAVDLVRSGHVKPKTYVRPFRDLPTVYEELEKGDIAGRVVLKIGEDPSPDIG
jgi:D-arabinose 1-dehydrogenase-like Zn-dependent alcohol dehydrogenase